MSNDDADSIPITESFTITVKDVFERPTNIELNNSSIAQNVSNGTVIEHLIPDDDDNEMTFYSLTNSDSLPFSINNNELIKSEPLSNTGFMKSQ